MTFVASADEELIDWRSRTRWLIVSLPTAGREAGEQLGAGDCGRGPTTLRPEAAKLPVEIELASNRPGS